MTPPRTTPPHVTPEGGGASTTDTQAALDARAVVDIVREVLELNEAGPGAPVALADDLYDLGFDSLLVVQVAARVRERLGVDPPLAAYFDAGTVADLAAAVTAARRSTLEAAS